MLRIFFSRLLPMIHNCPLRCQWQKIKNQITKIIVVDLAEVVIQKDKRPLVLFFQLWQQQKQQRSLSFKIWYLVTDWCNATGKWLKSTYQNCLTGNNDRLQCVVQIQIHSFYRTSVYFCYSAISCKCVFNFSTDFNHLCLYKKPCKTWILIITESCLLNHATFLDKITSDR